MAGIVPPPPFQFTPLQQIFYQQVPAAADQASPSYIPLPTRPRSLRVPLIRRAVWVPLPPLSVPPPPAYLPPAVYKRLRFRARGRRLGADLVSLQFVPPTPQRVPARRWRGFVARKTRIGGTVSPIPAPIPAISVRRRGLPVKRPKNAVPPVVPAAVVPNPPITFTSWIRRRGLVVRRGLSRLPWPQALQPVASIGQLTAADRGPGNTATDQGPRDTSSTAGLATLTASDQKTGGPS